MELSTISSPNSVIVLVDAFTAAYMPTIATSAQTILSRMGFTPHLIPLGPSGKPAYIKGFRKLFKRQGERVLRRLNTFGNTPVVIIDPSLSSMFSEEYSEIAAITVKPTPIAQFINIHKDKLPKLSSTFKGVLMPHCMERSGPRATIDAWRDIFAHIGFDISIGNVGCCGMAGTFGHEIEHVSQSKTIFNLSWAPTIAKDKSILATGFSCRHQILRCTSVTPSHPLEAIAHAL